MSSKRVIILGSGISGLSVAWYVHRLMPSAEIVILEKSGRAGGWLHTDLTTGFHFEKGPRTFKVDKSPHTLQLVQELQLEDELIWSEEKPHHRYLWFHEKLHPFPRDPLAFLFSPLTRGFVPALLTEWCKPVHRGDETVWEFVTRRFNRKIAERFFDPMVVGIFGGDVRSISMKACFPTLKRWEETYGSVTQGFWKTRKEKKSASFLPHLPLTAIYSWRGGIESLIRALVHQIPASIHYETEATHSRRVDNLWHVHTPHGVFSGDFLISALPVRATAQLFSPLVPELAHALEGVRSQGIVVVNAGYTECVLPVEGFGYLTPSLAQEDVLGVVFDSSVFPQHNRQEKETRLTIKLRETPDADAEVVAKALQGIRKHLGVSRSPDALSVKRAREAIPQYEVGHLEKMVQLDQDFRRLLPRCYLVGNYLTGVSVDQCIAHAKHVAKNLCD